jgi:hypothetical protein
MQIITALKMKILDHLHAKVGLAQGLQPSNNESRILNG